MHLQQLIIENFRIFGSGDQALTLQLQPGLNVLAGENDSGKSSIVDAIRFALGTTSQDYQRLTEDDFNIKDAVRATELKIRCKFVDIEREIGGALVEHLTYDGDKPSLYVTFTGKRHPDSARKRVSYVVGSGLTDPKPLDGEARTLLYTTYLKPLRNAERELDAGRNSRLSQILQHTKEILEHNDEEFDPKTFVEELSDGKHYNLPKSMANISLLADHLIQANEGVVRAGKRLDDKYLTHLALGDEKMTGRVSVAGAATTEQRLRGILEKLELRLTTLADPDGRCPHGLGYSNLLFMACELLLLGQDEESLPLLLIEEPEAHLHPQLQMRLVEFLQEQADTGRKVQIILTTHSPNLASKVKLKSMILINEHQAFPLGPEYTQLSDMDYRFLERFLDVTKSNLFFARGVVIVEGDAENLLIPALARLLGRDFTKHGVSVVNVGSRGLRRYARIFRRKQLPGADAEPTLIPVHVACLADRDVLPDVAKEILEATEKRTLESNLGEKGQKELVARLSLDDGENVRTFVSDWWTLEYDLAYAGLDKLVNQAAKLAVREESRTQGNGNEVTEAEHEKIKTEADKEWEEWKTATEREPAERETVSCNVYKRLYNGLSKTMVAQHLVELLESSGERDDLATKVPTYIRKAIEYVTGAEINPSSSPQHSEAGDA